MRGPLVAVGPGEGQIGIIPAYAGTTPAPALETQKTQDHPRLCGDHFFYKFCLTPIIGSSPPMRGPQDAEHTATQYRGIIPAYAGTTTVFKIPTSFIKDHPRLCGDHTKYPKGATITKLNKFYVNQRLENLF